MKIPSHVIKLAVVASSVVLVGGFVAYRAGAFDWLAPSSARPADTGSDVLMSGSKDMVPLITTSPDTQSATAQQPAGDSTLQPFIFGGSKSAIFPLFPPPPPSVQEQIADQLRREPSGKPSDPPPPDDSPDDPPQFPPSSR